MNEPSSWFREESSRAPSELERMFSKGNVKAYRCKLLKQDCQYVSGTGAGDCRRCNFALAYLLANPQIIEDILKDGR